MPVLVWLLLGQAAGKSADPPAADKAEKVAKEAAPSPRPALSPAGLAAATLGTVAGPVRELPVLIGVEEAPTAKAELKPSDQGKLLGASMGVYSDTPDDKAAWKLRAEAGGNFRQGNNSSSAFNALLQAERISTSGRMFGKVGANYNQLNEQLANQRYFGEALADRNLRGHWVSYLREEAENDQVRKIALRSITSAGLGFRFLDDAWQRWVVRSGPTVTALVVDGEGDSQRISQARFGWLVESEFRRRLGETSRFEWTMTLYPDFRSDQTFRMKNEAALLFPIGGVKSNWNWKIGARQEYQTQPLGGAKPNDVEAFFNIVFSK